MDESDEVIAAWLFIDVFVQPSEEQQVELARSSLLPVAPSKLRKIVHSSFKILVLYESTISNTGAGSPQSSVTIART